MEQEKSMIFNCSFISKVKPLEQVEILADKRYQGIKKIHTSSYTPIKKKKEKALALREKEYNP
jgi:hypothetical protein